MLKSKNFFVTLLVALALLTTMANATVSRLEGLGGSGDSYWWNLPANIFVLHDAATPAVWPQLVQQYPNLAGGEFGDATGSWGLDKVYVNYSWEEKRNALQFILDKPVSNRFWGMPDPRSDGGVPSRLMANYGRKMGDNLLFGIGLSYWGDSEKQKDDADTLNGDQSFEESASIIGLKFGLSGVGETEWDAVVGLELPSFKDEASGQNVSEKDGSMGIHFAGRLWWHYDEKASLIPNLRFNTYAAGVDYSDTLLTDTKVTHTQIGIGVGHNWWPVENALVLSDFGILLQTEKWEFVPAGSDYDVNDNFLPYWRIGFETSVFGWLDGRLGAERNWQSNKESGDSRPLEPEYSTSSTNTFLGATAHWNRMIFDLVVHPDFIGQGPDFVSGAGSDNIFTRVSLKYDFNQ